MTPRTVQAHCTYLTPEEFSRLAQHGTAIAHCPLSNAYFSGRQLALREALDRGVRVGLGTDIAGGYCVDIMGSMRWSVGMSRISEGARLERSGSQATASEDQVVKAESNSKCISVNWKEALYLGTMGGALALGLDSGVFKTGVPFDAQQSRHCLSSLTLLDNTLTLLEFSKPFKSKFGSNRDRTIGLPCFKPTVVRIIT